MDDQRLEEIAEKTFWEIESHIYANRDTLAKMVIAAAIREALASQEEALRSFRGGWDVDWKSRYEEEYAIVDRVWKAVRGGAGYKGEELSGIVTDYVKRAESAEAEVKRLAHERNHLDHCLSMAKDSYTVVDAALQRLREWVTVVHDRFVASEAQGYRSRDRQYAIDMLGKALEVVASPVEEQSTTASDVIGTMDSEGPFVEPPGRPTSC
jgi:hypothetical protein